MLLWSYTEKENTSILWVNNSQNFFYSEFDFLISFWIRVVDSFYFSHTTVHSEPSGRYVIPTSKISASLLCLELSSKPLELICKVVRPCTDYNHVKISICLTMTVIFKDGKVRKRMCALETTKHNNDIPLIFHYLSALLFCDLRRKGESSGYSCIPVPMGTRPVVS